MATSRSLKVISKTEIIPVHSSKPYRAHRRIQAPDSKLIHCQQGVGLRVNGLSQWIESMVD